MTSLLTRWQQPQITVKFSCLFKKSKHDLTLSTVLGIFPSHFKILESLQVVILRSTGIMIYFKIDIA